jgi:hypothetical protein
MNLDKIDTIVVTDQGVYGLDMRSLHKKMSEMAITIEVPKLSDIFMRPFIDHAPVLQVPCSVLITTIDCGPYTVDEFVFLFPLGKRGYIKKRYK